MAKLRKAYGWHLGKGAPNLAGLRSLQERLKSLVRVRAAQVCKARRREKETKLVERVARRGPGDRPREQGALTQTQVTQTQVKEMETYWKRVWETEGTYDPNHPSLRKWT